MENSPQCPKCGRPMVMRTARKGRKEGRRFQSCTGFPDHCRGTLDYHSSGSNGGRSREPEVEPLLPRRVRSRQIHSDLDCPVSEWC